MKKTVYVDGQHGTTGLEIQKYIENHPNLSLMTIPFEERHHKDARKERLNTCDIAILCLPDDGSREAVAMIENDAVTIIDTSTAHRTLDTWCYGLPELSLSQKEKLIGAQWIANPGCHASAAILLIKPLIESGLIRKDQTLKLYSITGYSGGGKSMIAEFESGKTLPPRHYALGLSHKHIPEMMKYLDLLVKPIFMPVIGAYKRGILLSAAFELSEFTRPVDQETLLDMYKAYYETSELAFIGTNTGAAIEAETHSFGNRFEIDVNGNEDQFLLTIKLDNLGKGAGGAAIQTINLKFGWDVNLGI